ncbi:beta-galactosidase [Cohnella lubricantis]|uniref:Beta-galactosidase n=1 Tax=Cohnella lubricantis TaxID=2163172 RepID=A0A841TGN9_9BACL|nr:beta-galactosidase [Cohnella lubricantis]MBB6678400.1 beta-galactosidase [Cohnella lubricantis]MBP2116780.1 beta-galactosidase [Cohnella lubricantis]
MDNQILIGTSYYSEHWPRERWPEDIRLMREAGINVLRVSELAWSRLEPTEGNFDFAWLDDFMEMASREGIRFILTTPIEGSPVWLRHKHPEVVRADEFGRIHADRGFHCHTSRIFAHYVARIVEKMAEHYADHPAVIGWQIDNELRAVHCYCDECRIEFRKWLRVKYGTLDHLNEAWGTVFWSQIYNEWEEVELPAADQLTKSISQLLDFYRFSSDATAKHLNMQVDIIKRHAPHHKVTHNSLGLYIWLDLYKLAKKLDVMGVDLYPDVDTDNVYTCLNLDVHRSVKRDNMWIMEQKNGYFNYSDYNLAIEPGLVRFWTYQDIARGGNAVLYYRWRSGRFSWEQNPNGILRHDGTPRRAYDEIKQVTRELAGFSSDLAGTRVESPVAILHSYDQIWAFESQKQYSNFNYRKHITAYYRELLRMGITPDLIDPAMDLSGYAFVVAPSMSMVSDEIRENLERYVREGGCLIIGARSGMKSWENTTIDTPWPGLLSDMAGIEIDEFEVLPDHYSNGIVYRNREYRVNSWLDMIKPKGAETLAAYTEKFYAGRTAISVNRFGEGRVYYVGVMGSRELIRDILCDVADERGVVRQQLPDDVFLTRRSDGRTRFAFYLNYGREPRTVSLAEEGTDAMTGAALSGEATIPALGVLVVRTGA